MKWKLFASIVIGLWVLVACKKEDEIQVQGTTSATVVHEPTNNVLDITIGTSYNSTSEGLPHQFTARENDMASGTSVYFSVAHLDKGMYEIGEQAQLNYMRTVLSQQEEFTANEGTIEITEVSNGKVSGRINVLKREKTLLTNRVIYTMSGTFNFVLLK